MYVWVGKGMAHISSINFKWIIDPHDTIYLVPTKYQGKVCNGLGNQVLKMRRVTRLKDGFCLF